MSDGGKRQKYELWVEGIKVKTLNEFRSGFVLVSILRMVAGNKYAGKEFEIFHIVKSKGNKMENLVEEEIKPVVKKPEPFIKPEPLKIVVHNGRPPAEYSNKSPFKIAR